MERKLQQMEKKHSILQRWIPDSSQYQSTKEMQAQKTRSDIFMKLEKCARERWFLLTIKAKYAGTYKLYFYKNNFIPQMVNTWHPIFQKQYNKRRKS